MALPWMPTVLSSSELLILAPFYSSEFRINFYFMEIFFFGSFKHEMFSIQLVFLEQKGENFIYV